MSLHTFITNLQNSDGNRKFRWLVGLTLGTMAVIIGIWALASPDRANTTSDLVRKDDQPGFFGKIALGADALIETLREKTANTIYFFSQRLGTTNTIKVTAEDKDKTLNTKSETTSNEQIP